MRDHQATSAPLADDRTSGSAVRRRWAFDGCALLAILLLVPVVHRVGPALRSPYWLDESWVALSTKAPLADLPWTTAQSPLGWTFLVWLLPPTGQIHRLVPLAFLAGSVLAAYTFCRMLGWPDRTRAVLAGMLGATAALVLPAQQLRHDLKQYTADAAVALTLFALLAWAEAAWSRRRAAIVAGGIVAGMLFSHTAALVGGAVLAGALAAAALSRRPRRLAETAVLVAITGIGMIGVYLTVDRSGHNTQAAAYWADYFPALRNLPHYLLLRLDQLSPALGIPWPVFVLIALLGVATVARSHRPATAVALALLPLIAVTAGVGRLYPLLDQRTSHFLLVTGAVVAGVGLAGVAARLRSVTGTGVGLAGVAARLRPVARILVAVLAMGAFVIANLGALRHPPAPGAAGEDVRAQVVYVAAHRDAGDVIVVNLSGEYGFAYYWSGDRPRFVQGGSMATGWYVSYPPSDRIVVADGRDPDAVGRALAHAEQLATGRIWLVRSHVVPDEARAWRAALAGRRVELIAVGPEPVGVISV